MANRGSRGSGTAARAGCALGRDHGSGRRALLPGSAGRRPAYLLARLLDVDPDHARELAREGVDLGLVADRGHQPRGLADGVDPAVGPVEVVLADDVAEHEAVERHPPRDQLAHRPVALLDAQVARVEPGRLDGDVGLGDEVLVAGERADRGLLAGRVAVEGEDHLAAELLVVVQEPPQHPRVLVAERRAARRDGGRHPGEVAGHHVGVALDDDGLGRAGHVAAGQVDAVEHLALLVERGLGGVEVLGLDLVVVEDPARPEADRVAARVADGPQQAAAEPVVRRPPCATSPAAMASSSLKPFWRRCRTSASPSRGAKPMPNCSAAAWSNPRSPRNWRPASASVAASCSA